MANKALHHLQLALVLFLGLMVGGGLAAQEPAPTLIPPTPVPMQDSSPDEGLVSESAIGRIQAAGVVRVGVLFNQPPFAELNIRGEVVGYDADLARSLAESWGVEVEFAQVTRQTAIPTLLADQIDLLIAAQVHRRTLEDVVEFSGAYYLGEQAMMVRLDEAAASVDEMVNRRVGVVMGTPSEAAVAYWQQRRNITVEVQRFITIDEALVALVAGEIDGVIGKRYRLRDLVQPDAIRVMDGTIQPEPYAVALRRQDVNLRQLVNHTLHFLAATGRIEEIHNEHFPSQYPERTVRVWADVGESAPTINTYGTDVPYPGAYVVPRLQAGEVLRIAGVPQPLPQEPESERRVAAANAGLAQAFGQRWGVPVQFVPADDPLAAVARGEADMALGVRATWSRVNQVDFTSAYMLRGKRMMTTVRDDYTSLADLRGKWVGVFASEPNAADLVVSLGQSVNANLRTFSITDESAVRLEMLEENNVDVVFGDSVRLLPHVQADPETLKFSDRCPNCDPWYTREYYSIAVPRNDVDFRLLVEYTLQELWLDGTLANLMQAVTVPDDALELTIWPGDASYLSITFGS